MARYQVILAYDGAGFAGSQRQAKKRTVQGQLEEALCRLGWTGKSVILAGRTDAGVHASGQVAAFDLDWAHSTDDLRNALNANLPADMAVRSAGKAPQGFHPRFDALSRRYRYRLYCEAVRHPLRERFAWRVWPPLDESLLPDLASLWLGTHDFAAFGSPPRPGSSTVRTIFAVSWQAQGDEWIFEVQADAFLYHMVRRLVYVQVAVAQAHVPAGAIARALQEPARALPRTEKIPTRLAPACGLTLVEVAYPVMGEIHPKE